MAVPLSPPFAYFGGKTRIAAQIARLLPAHRHYVEPYAGSLAVLLAKPPVPFETVNDLDGKLMTFWRVLRDRPAELARACALTPHSRAEHATAAEPPADGDEIETARRVWIAITQSRTQTTRPGTWRRFTDAEATNLPPAEYLAAYAARIPAAAARIRRVSLESRPALDVIAEYGKHPATLIYADPPYPEEARSAAWRGRYAAEMMGDAAHEDLATAVGTVRGGVVISGYDCPLYRHLYAGWYRVSLRATVNTGAAAAEILWSNRPLITPATLWDGHDG